MNTRKLKKAAKYLQRKLAQHGVTVTSDEAQQAIAESAYVEENYGLPGTKFTPHGAASYVWLMERYN
jgi:hypothetical protein